MIHDVQGRWGAQPDGTYVNPILNADYSDPDVVREGNCYYMISSTIQCSPGMVILESEDLVNWKTVGSVIQDLSGLYPYLGCDQMGAYNKGVYAGSLRHLQWKERDEKGTYVCRDKWFVYTTVFQGGILVSTADQVKGPWHTRFMRDKNGKELRSPFLDEEEKGVCFSKEERERNLLPGLYWDDNCPYWELEEDGTLKAAYMVASKTNGAWYPHVFRMSLDGMALLDGELESMCAFGDHTRKRSADGSVVDPEGKKIPSCGKMGETDQIVYTAQGDISSIVNAVQVPGKEGCVIRDIISGEALKVFRISRDTRAGKERFNGRHGRDEMVADYIYLFDSEVDHEGVRIPMMHRAKCIYGDRFDGEGNYLGPGTPENPGGFESFALLVGKKEPVDEREPNQGAFVDVPACNSRDGMEHWYFITHHGNEKAGPNGRPVSLLEAQWIEGWPIPGYQGTGEKQTGVMQWQGEIPVKGYSTVKLRFQDSDNFGEGRYGGMHNSSREALSPVWFWNHAPKDHFWSLKEREGWLRMYAFKTADGSGDFFQVGNVLAQRYVDSRQVLAETQMSICGMCAGQRAGLAHFNGGKWYTNLEVRKESDGTFSLFRREKRISVLPENTVSLQLKTQVTEGVAGFWFRPGNELQWRPADEDGFPGEKLRPGGYRGDCIGLYTCNDQWEKGYVDFDYFRYEW